MDRNGDARTSVQGCSIRTTLRALISFKALDMGTLLVRIFSGVAVLLVICRISGYDVLSTSIDVPGLTLSIVQNR
jgi:hypothetical protein